MSKKRYPYFIAKDAPTLSPEDRADLSVMYDTWYIYSGRVARTGNPIKLY